MLFARSFLAAPASLVLLLLSGSFPHLRGISAHPFWPARCCHGSPSVSAHVMAMSWRLSSVPWQIDDTKGFLESKVRKQKRLVRSSTEVSQLVGKFESQPHLQATPEAKVPCFFVAVPNVAWTEPAPPKIASGKSHVSPLVSP